MLRLQHNEFGDPATVLQLLRTSSEPPAPDEVTIRIEVTPIHPGDLYNIAGQKVMVRNVSSGDDLKVPLPQVPGIEGVGHITALGSQVSQWSVGQRVLLPFQCGSWRSTINVPAAPLIAVPESTDPCQLALMVNALTAELALQDLITLHPGDWIIQNCANSSVGRLLISLAKCRGIKTVNLVRRSEVVDELLSLGADVVLEDGDELIERVAEATGGADIKLGLDGVAGAATARMGACLVDGGTLANYGLMSNEPCQLPSWMLLYKALKVRGYYMGFHRRRRSSEEQHKIIDKLCRLMDDGTIHAKVAATYELKDFKVAVHHAAQQGQDREGKILFRC